MGRSTLMFNKGKEAYRDWKQGWNQPGRNTIIVCTAKNLIRKAIYLKELNLRGDIKSNNNNKKKAFKYIGNKRKLGETWSIFVR